MDFYVLIVSQFAASTKITLKKHKNFVESNNWTKLGFISSFSFIVKFFFILHVMHNIPHAC